MATNQQRRAAERRLLQKQLEQRRVREARRKRTVLISSVVGALVVVAAVIIAVVTASSGGDTKKNAGGNGTPTAGGPTSSSPAASSSSAPVDNSPAVAASFDGVQVKNSKNLTKDPAVTAKSSKTPTKLEYKDLVVGKGQAATAKSTVAVQYAGVLYKNGKAFDSSWSRGGQPASFSLAQVVPGFTQGIGGTTGVPPMKVGGRRIIILPAKLGYGSQGNQSIPPNSPLVFVVDLTKVTG